jgi:hypothetical protein
MPGGFSLGNSMNNKPQTYNGNINKLPPALAHLRDQRVWLCWRWFWNGKKWTKPPYRADDPERYASTSDPATWGSYEQAVAQVRAGKADGIGFALKGRDIGAIDLDHCRNPQTMEIEPWAHNYMERCPGAYVEATVSGAGLRILGTSELQDFAPKLKLNGHAIELFSNSRHYLTLSCNEIGICNELPPIGAAIKKIAVDLGGQPIIDKQISPRAAGKPAHPADAKRVASALAVISADDRDIWFRFGAILKDAFGEERGRALWDHWSQTSKEKFNAADQERVWRSITGSAKPAGLGTIILHAIKNGWREDGSADAVDYLATTAAADLEMEGLDWLWPGRFARGKFGLIAGLPDMGKGQIAAFITAAVTAEADLPCSEGTAPQGNVIWFNAEDGARDTVLPRLVAAGANLSGVHFVNGSDKTFSLVTDLPLLRKAIERIGNVVLVIIDPVGAYLGVGKVDGRSATDVRGVLTPMKDMAEELHIAIIGIAHFNKKDDIKSALLRVSDSIAWVAAARHVGK